MAASPLRQLNRTQTIMQGASHCDFRYARRAKRISDDGRYMSREFKRELAKHKTGKGSIHLPYERRLPETPIRKIAALRIKELREKDVRWM